MSKPTSVVSDSRVLGFIKKGVEAVAIPTMKTLGPDAGLTLMYRTFNRGPRAVDDGYYTAEAIVPKNPNTRLVAEFFKEAVAQTNRRVGDGTTGTCVVAHALFMKVYSILQPVMEGFSSKKTSTQSVFSIRRDILKAADEVKELIKKAAKPVDTLEDLEKISAISLGENNTISKTIAKLCFDVGIDGFVDVVEGYKGEVEIEKVEGMRFPAKIADKAFVNRKERFEMEVEDSPVFITNYKMDSVGVVQFLIEQFNSSKITIIAPEFSNTVLGKMALSFQSGIQIWPVKVPSLRTEHLEDIATFCDAILLDKNKGMKLENASAGNLGFLQKLIVKDVESREDAIALGGRGEKTEKVKKQIEILKGQLAETKEPQMKGLVEKRIASLASRGGVIRVGAPTDAESLPLKLKVEDVKFACRAALRGGYVAGGGLCLKDISDTLSDNHILKDALLAPYRTIQANAGGELAIGDDVIDPAEAIYYAVEHATSVVASLITIKTLITEEEEIQNGQGEFAIARAVGEYVTGWKKKEGLLSEGEKAAMDDARMGLSDDEWAATHQD